jgi:zinc transport system permease protein
MIDGFLIRAALAGLGVALAAAPLGCFVVWRRMAYFGDATAHSAILGVALALAFSLPVYLGVVAVALIAALFVASLNGRGFATDTLLGVVAHSALAFGLVAASFLSGVRVDLTAYLFGDILAVGWSDIALIWGGAVLVLALLWWRWSALITATLSPELAHAAGLDPKREQMILTIALALTVAVAIKVVGARLIGAMLVIPAAAARPFSNTPEAMARFAALIGAAAALSGLAGAYAFDTPTGPSIVCAAAILFALSGLARLVHRPG